MRINSIKSNQRNRERGEAAVDNTRPTLWWWLVPPAASWACARNDIVDESSEKRCFSLAHERRQERVAQWSAKTSTMIGVAGDAFGQVEGPSRRLARWWQGARVQEGFLI
ncbi:hypothetical protein LR48_Vigan06g110600 [Vigna angularis]|uniref:Uncharacterized protein n=1 Tax=Phaseolus angularis TaxID=3914 RepID=A0A0L9USD9_PHAAN|nr:hypothetical protein LR48_Vigan06g110600 [Vigna angularis]